LEINVEERAGREEGEEKVAEEQVVKKKTRKRRKTTEQENPKENGKAFGETENNGWLARKRLRRRVLSRLFFSNQKDAITIDTSESEEEEVVKPTPKKRGRPTKEETERRRQAAAHARKFRRKKGEDKEDSKKTEGKEMEGEGKDKEGDIEEKESSSESEEEKEQEKEKGGKGEVRDEKESEIEEKKNGGLKRKGVKRKKGKKKGKDWVVKVKKVGKKGKYDLRILDEQDVNLNIDPAVTARVFEIAEEMGYLEKIKDDLCVANRTSRLVGPFFQDYYVRLQEYVKENRGIRYLKRSDQSLFSWYNNIRYKSSKAGTVGDVRQKLVEACLGHSIHVGEYEIEWNKRFQEYLDFLERKQEYEKKTGRHQP